MAPRLAGLALAVLTMAAAPAPPTTPMMTALRAQDWEAADRLASQEADPRLAADLVDFIRMLKPAQATPEEIQTFLAAHAAWPDRAVLTKRLGEAVSADGDDAAVLPICLANRLAASPLSRCAAAFDAAGRQAAAADAARAAWAGGLSDPQNEPAFLARWGAAITPADEWKRFGLFAGTNPAAAAAEIPRLDPDHRLAALARLAWRHDDADALSRLALVPAALRGEPSLVLENARSLRRTGATAAAVALWRGAGIGAEAAVPAEARGAFWAERDALARRLLAEGAEADAAFLAGDTIVGSDQALDALFLAGWIALRRLHDAPAAAADFSALAERSKSAITQGRAHYWFARALQDQGKAAEAHEQLAAAARLPVTYYGQQAALLLGDQAARLQGLADPAWTPAQALGFAGQDLARSAELLSAWGDSPRARDFLLRFAEQNATDAARAWAANLALRLNLPDSAVLIARMDGRSGGMLPGAGWPIPVQVPAENGPLLLAIMRQESNFDPAVTSPAGARGLMQVMPATARTLQGGSADLFDPDANVRIGSAYVQRLLETFSGETALAAAAYNAGPNRVRTWLAAGDPSGNQERLIDWIELIPFSETRNYVQRVLEGETIYAHKLAR